MEIHVFFVLLIHVDVLQCNSRLQKRPSKTQSDRSI